MDHARQTGPAVEAHSRFLLWLVPTGEKFPRSQKFYSATRHLEELILMTGLEERTASGGAVVLVLGL